MAYYRLYSLDLKDVHFTDFVHFEADNDVAAIIAAKIGHFGVSRELWNQGRKVMDFA